MNGRRAVVADADLCGGLRLPEHAGVEGPRGDELDGRVPDGEFADRPGTFLSLFTGIGGLDLALEHLGWECVGQVEWDDYCTGILERHWPTVPRWGDVSGFTAASFAERRFDELRRGPGDVLRTESATRLRGQGAFRGRYGVTRHSSSAVDLICGGFPCQPVSHAGKRKGTTDDRWLWPEFARVIGELRPRWVVLENVPGIFTANGGRALSEVLGDLASLGFDARWTCVRASDVGAPHRRERFFLVADSQDADRREGSEGEQSGAGFGWRGLGGGTDDASDSLGNGLEGFEPAGAEARAALGGRDVAWGPYRPAIERWEAMMGTAPAPLDSGRLSADFVEWMMAFEPKWTAGKRNQRLKALGNAVVWPQAVLALRMLGLQSAKRNRDVKP
jgi:DNA (cytosine-5)-methyltransferase 1